MLELPLLIALLIILALLIAIPIILGIAILLLVAALAWPLLLAAAITVLIGFAIGAIKFETVSKNGTTIARVEVKDPVTLALIFVLTLAVIVFALLLLALLPAHQAIPTHSAR